MSLSTQPYKGARDFYPADKRKQDYIFGKIREVVKSFGYEEYDAPIIEPLDLYRAKTGDEIVNEQVYSFTDRGDREVAIRPEMTPTVSRMVAGRRQELAYPLRWFSIPNLWRYERPQRGRLREHWQLNVDLFGESGLTADHEIILIADTIMKKFGAKSNMYEIRINSRVLLNEQIKQAGVTHTPEQVVRLIDGFEKIQREEFDAKLATLVQNSHQLLKFLDGSEGNDETRALIKLLESSGVNARFVPSLARGFDYYNDIVFEVFDTNPDNNRSMFGGGRYDGLVGLFGVEPVPTVGFGMGDVTLANFLEIHGLLPDLQTDIDAAVILIGDVYVEAQSAIAELRSSGLNLSVDATDRKIASKLKHAEKSGVKHVVFIGDDELKNGVFQVKNLQTGEESRIKLAEVSDLIKG